MSEVVTVKWLWRGSRERCDVEVRRASLKAGRQEAVVQVVTVDREQRVVDDGEEGIRRGSCRGVHRRASWRAASGKASRASHRKRAVISYRRQEVVI